MIDVTTPGGEYRQAAVDKFNALKAAYASNDTGQQAPFWKLGNSFDTMTDFLETIDSSSAHDVAQMAVTQFAPALRRVPGGADGAWFDDFGWWSVATSRALEKPFFKPDAKAIRGILDECWTRFTKNAPFVWKHHKPRTHDGYAPAVEGGVWNTYWTDTPDKYKGPKEGDPSGTGSQPLAGLQNTVTNALYLNTAHRLGHTDTHAREAARKELHFLLTWFDEKETPLWWAFDRDTGLVRERVGHFAKGTRAWGFQENFAWAGDQGLMLGNLSDAMMHLPPVRDPLLGRLKQLLEGVRQHITTNGVVGGYTHTGTPPDELNYQTGSGIFWRNALYVWNTNPDLKAVLQGQEYQAMIRASAEAAKHPDDGSIQALTNDTAALVAACAMLV
jgi:hypothetical protein